MSLFHAWLLGGTICCFITVTTLSFSAFNVMLQCTHCAWFEGSCNLPKGCRAACFVSLLQVSGWFHQYIHRWLASRLSKCQLRGLWSHWCIQPQASRQLGLSLSATATRLQYCNFMIVSCTVEILKGFESKQSLLLHRRWHSHPLMLWFSRSSPGGNGIFLMNKQLTQSTSGIRWDTLIHDACTLAAPIAAPAQDSISLCVWRGQRSAFSFRLAPMRSSPRGRLRRTFPMLLLTLFSIKLPKRWKPSWRRTSPCPRQEGDSSCAFMWLGWYRSTNRSVVFFAYWQRFRPTETFEITFGCFDK